MQNTALTTPGTASTQAGLTDGFSAPTNVQNGTGNDIAFALSFSEAVSFVSSHSFIRGRNPATQANGSIAAANWSKMSVPFPDFSDGILAYGAWLRSPGDVTNTIGAVSFEVRPAGDVLYRGRAFQIHQPWGQNERGFIYPALWVDQAIFQPDTITITYNANGGNDPPPPQVVAPGNVTLSNQRPWRTGYDFLGWALSQTATVPDYQANQTVNFTASTTLYAVWKQMFTISYNANGGNDPPPSQRVPLGNAALSNHEPWRPGYDFLGWSTNPFATVREYSPGQTIYVNRDIPLYAVWRLTPMFNITYDANGGINPPPSQTVPAGNVQLRTGEPSFTGFRFLGWATTATATVVQYNPGQTVYISDHLALFAVWNWARVNVVHRDSYTNQTIKPTDEYVIPAGSYGPYAPSVIQGYGPGRLAAGSAPASGNISMFSTTTITYIYDKTKTVTGYVSPIATMDWGLGPGFLNQHSIDVELRATFNTPAPANLKTKAVVSNVAGRGVFTIEGVLPGSYILYIKRPGYLVRAMPVTITLSSPDVVHLAPPGAADGGVFNLWWGDCNGDLRVDGLDIMMIVEIMNVTATQAGYNPACDLNADARVDGLDMMLTLEHINLYSLLYAGMETVDVFG